MDEAPQKPKWRRGFQEHVQAWIEQLRDWRRDHVGPAFDVKGRNKFPYQLNDDQILEIAREESARDMNRAIWEWNYSADRRAERAAKQ